MLFPVKVPMFAGLPKAPLASDICAVNTLLEPYGVFTVNGILNGLPAHAFAGRVPTVIYNAEGGSTEKLPMCINDHFPKASNARMYIL